MKVNYYPDHTTYITIEEDEPVERVWRINSPSDLWLLYQYVDAYVHKFKSKPIITIPNLFDAQADRRFAPNESSGLKLVLEFLRSMKADFKIFHPHNPEVVEALLPDAELIDSSDFLRRVLEKDFDYGKEEDPSKGFIPRYKNLTILAPDAGAFKWVDKVCDKIGWPGTVESASKSRPRQDSSDSGKVKLKQQLPLKDFGGKDVIIVDDISIYGGTFKGLSGLLQESNCGKIYLAVSHITVWVIGEEDKAVTNFFEKVYTTDSKHSSYKFECTDPWGDGIGPEPKNLEVIKLFGDEK